MWKKDAKKCETMALGSHFGAPGSVLDGPGRPGAAQGRPKSGFFRPKNLRKSELRVLCDALWRSWALHRDVVRIWLNFG